MIQQRHRSDQYPADIFVIWLIKLLLLLMCLTSSLILQQAASSNSSSSNISGRLTSCSQDCSSGDFTTQ